METENKQKRIPANYRPSVDDAEWFVKYWKGLPNYSDQELALDKLFMVLCPENNCIEDICIVLYSFIPN